MYTLVIAEKPSSAQKIAQALADGGIEKKAKNRVSYYEFSHDGRNMVVVPAVGHLYGLEQASGGSGYPVFDVKWKPSYQVSKTSAFTKAYLDLIEDLAKGANDFIAATDFDIEGEVIAANVLDFACRAKAAKRMKFSTLTREDLLEAHAHLMPTINAGMASAGRTRHELDYYWGISLSRALMHAIKSAGRFKVMSIGRVQGPALAILSKREKEILGFKPVPYWVLLALASGVEFEHVHGNFFEKAEAEKAFANSSKGGRVSKVARTQYEQAPPNPFDLTTLQTEAHRCFSMSPSRTLEVAQKLYEQALISYPRTSSQKLPPQLNLPKIVSKLRGQPAYAALADRLIKENLFTPNEGKQSDPAHPAIHPTGEVPGGLSPEEQKLYDLVVKRFLSCLAPAAIRDRMSVELLLGKEAFKAGGARTITKNWMEFYAPYAELQEVTLPNFTEGAPVEAEKIWVGEKKTQPPKRFTEASLVRKLEEEELGTKATRSAVIQTLFDRGYITGKSIEVTPFGMSVYDALSQHSPEILSEQLTREFEKEMDDIQENRAASAEILAHGRAALGKIIEEFKQREESIGKELLKAFNTTQRGENTLGKCNLCEKGMLVMRKSKYGMFVGCNAYPDCKNTFPLPRDAAVKAAKKICEKCGTPVVWVRRKGKRPWSMCLMPTCETKAAWAKGPAAPQSEVTVVKKPLQP